MAGPPWPLRKEILLAVRAAREAETDVLKFTIQDYALIGARVALEGALTAIKEIRLVPSSPHEKLITKLLRTRMSVAIEALKTELDP